jgi:predicted O-linked N-acetylglucosamine transferase (SPINDLY family)
MTTGGEPNLEAVLQRALALHRMARLDEAGAVYEQVLRIDPREPRALHLLGVLALQGNRAATAAQLFERVLAVDAGNFPALVNLGTAQQYLGRFAAAVASYDRALALKPDAVEALHNRGNALRALADPEGALESYDRALSIQSNYADALVNRGLALAELGRSHEAVESFDRAIASRPDYADAYFNRANELRRLGELEAALSNYDRALALQPGFLDAQLNRGTVLVELNRHSLALTAFDRAIALLPHRADAHYNRAGVLQHLGKFAAAVASYDQAIALRADHADSHANRARALREMQRLDAAIAGYSRALSLHPDSTALRGVLSHLKMQICDWTDWEADLGVLRSGIEAGYDPPNPFYVITLIDDGAVQRRAAENWCRRHWPVDPSCPDRRADVADDRIHLGYFSADYHDHATAYLIAQLFEMHDRLRFRVTAFSFGPESHSAMRRRLQAGCDAFIDVRGESDAEVARRARHLGIDIAVDLKGFTQNHRAGIFALRAAPVQVNYLGFPGTLGARFMDYIIADKVLIPEASREFYSESIVELPHSYQVNDTRRLISSRVFTREELGLPLHALVYCCFNNPYKITPSIFDRWMNLLRRVPGSVLWLLQDNSLQANNLREEARARGVDPERLVFAGRIDLPDHLARHRGADLFLDTLPCNAHTTASDALWAGVPVVTCAGEGFGARVAASLLRAIGLPELICDSLDDYEELAVRLACHEDERHRLRQRLAANRSGAPLFDTARYTHDIERAFTSMHARRRAGLPPDNLVV